MGGTTAENGSPTNGHSNGAANGTSSVRHVPLFYSSTDPDASALALIRTLRPSWVDVNLVRFTDGITNTLIKAENRAAISKEERDRDAVLLRAYGHGTAVLIDRSREAQNHELLMRHGLAPELLAKFDNGMMYRYVRGTVTTPADMRKPDISKAIARRLAQWHATVPCIPGKTKPSPGTVSNGSCSNGHHNVNTALDQDVIDNAAPGKPSPNLWTVMQKWILALPRDTEEAQSRYQTLQTELSKLIDELSGRPGLGHGGLVFAHTDLLSGNVIVLPPGSDAKDGPPNVNFIDYEYAVPSPAAFDIANHFAEWGGFDCDMACMPTVAQRRIFVDEYIRAYAACLSEGGTVVDEKAITFDPQHEADLLMAEIDLFRGLPGFYWGIWACIQARISQIDFDYANYAESRLGEYWAWKAEIDGSRAAKAGELCLRERRWAQES
jgi:ethanolamine kinase